MPAVWSDLLRMVACGGVVAAVVLPLAGAAWRLARRRGTPLLPHPRPWRAPWTGFDVLVAFLLLGPQLVPALADTVLSNAGVYARVYGEELTTTPPREGEPDPPEARERRRESATVRAMWAGLVSLPIQLAVVLLVGHRLYPGLRWADRAAAIPARVALVGAAWLLLSVTVHAIHLIVNLTFAELGWEPEQHSLARVATRPTLDRVLFAIAACVQAPIVEELFFRGVLLAWLLGRSYRVWPVLVSGVLMAVLSCAVTESLPDVFARGPVLFALALAGGWLVVGQLMRRKRRTVGAIYASAALFATVHSAVWPSPIPLFVLGLGLGWLAVRVRGVLVPAAVHGLFNAVSVLFVLAPG